MLTCAECGSNNLLGKLFCCGCGAKLNISHDLVSAKNISAHSDNRTGLGICVRFFILFVLVGMVIIGACIVPSLEPIGEKGSPWSKKKLQKLQSTLQMFCDVPKGQAMGRSFKESDINKYLEQEAVLRMGAIGCSVDVRKGNLDVRMVRKIQHFELGSFSYDLILSFDAIYEEEDGLFKIRSGRIGQLPLFGISAKIPSKWIKLQLMKLSAWKSFWCVESVRADEDILRVRVHNRV